MLLCLGNLVLDEVRLHIWTNLHVRPSVASLLIVIWGWKYCDNLFGKNKDEFFKNRIEEITGKPKSSLDSDSLLHPLIHSVHLFWQRKKNMNEYKNDKLARKPRRNQEANKAWAPLVVTELIHVAGADLGGGCTGCTPPPLEWPAVF